MLENNQLMQPRAGFLGNSCTYKNVLLSKQPSVIESYGPSVTISEGNFSLVAGLLTRQQARKSRFYQFCPLPSC